MRTLVRILVVTAMCVLGVVDGLSPAMAAEPEPTGVDAHVDAADPALVSYGDGWLVFTTNSFSGNMPVWMAEDGHAAVMVGDAMPELPSWVEAGHTWAPSVALLDGRWVAYYTARDRSSGRQCIGVATSAVATGPYVDDNDQPLICQIERGGSIDPSISIVGPGEAYLHWKSDDNAIGGKAVIWGARLNPAGTKLLSQPTVLIRADRRWEMTIVENPTMVPTSSGWTLLYSGGQWWNESYGTGFATCRGPLGPCTKRSTKSALWSGDDTTVGQGGASYVASGPDHGVLAVHGWPRASVGYDNGGQRVLRLVDVVFQRGRPVRVGS